MVSARWVAFVTWLAAAPTAVAGWDTTPTLAGLVNDAWPVADGKVGVGTANNAYELLAGGGGRTLTGDSVTAWVGPGDCLVRLGFNGTVSTSAGCNYAAPGGVLGLNFLRLRAVAGGSAMICAEETAGTGSQLFYSSDWSTSGWTSNLIDERCTRAMSMMQQNGDSWLLQAAVPGTFANNNALLYRNGIRESVAKVGAGNLAPSSVALVNDPSGMRAWVVDSSGLVHRSLVTGTTFGTFSQVPLPSGVSRFHALALYQSGTERFGMALVETAAGAREIYSAIPVGDPELFGTLWRPSTQQPSPSGTMQEVHCHGATTCALRTNATGQGSVGIYLNAQPPSGFTGPSATVDEGATASFTMNVTDPDGDAVVVSWTPAPGDPPAVLTLAPDGLSGSFQAPVLGGLCSGGKVFTYTLTATDGRAGHTTVGTATFTVVRATPPQAPVLTPADLVLPANASPARVEAAGAPGECPGLTFQWTPLQSDGITLLPGPGGAFVDVTVPRNVCEPTGRTVFFQARAENAHGASPPASLKVKVMPWGPPEVPFVDLAQSVTGGTTRTLTPEQVHVCHAGAGTPPEVVTDWILDSPLPADVTLSPPLPQGSPVTAAQLTVASSEACGTGSFSVRVRNRVADGGPSPDAPLTVTIVPDLQPLTEATLELALASDGSLSGTSSVDIDCAHLRQLQAQFVLHGPDGFTHQELQPVPGPFSLTPSFSVCVPTEFTLQATLEGTDGQVKSAPVVWTSEGTDEPVFGTVEPAPLLARCEDGQVRAEGELRHQPPANACLGQQTVWRSVSGVTTVGPSNGDAVRLEAVKDRWDELVGQATTLAVSARAGERSSAETEVTTFILPQAPFVSAQVTLDPPLVADTAVVMVTVDLENTTGCEVQHAAWTVMPERLQLIAGSAQVDGRPAEASQADGRWAIQGIVLAAHGRSRVTFAARPALFGQPRAPGQLELRGAAISEPVASANEPATAGCGCGAGSGASSGPGAWLLLAALGGLWLTGRRRSAAGRRHPPLAPPPGPIARSRAAR
jgi:MYXO-CTERM domain-containing protein